MKDKAEKLEEFRKQFERIKEEIYEEIRNRPPPQPKPESPQSRDMIKKKVSKTLLDQIGQEIRNQGLGGWYFGKNTPEEDVAKVAENLAREVIRKHHLENYICPKAVDVTSAPGRHHAKVELELCPDLDVIIEGVWEEISLFNKQHTVDGLTKEYLARYTLLESEAKKLAEWRMEHPCTSSLSVTLGSCAIGHTAQVRCDKCGEVKSITDTSTW